MSERDETREELIKRHWKRYGGHWPLDKIGPVYNMPVRHKLDPYFIEDVDLVDVKPILNKLSLNKLSFRFERGTWRGRPGYRVTCEDVVVEEGPL